VLTPMSAQRGLSAIEQPIGSGILVALAASEKDSDRDEKGVQLQSATTAMKIPECSELQMTDRVVTTCRLPLQFHGVEHNPK